MKHIGLIFTFLFLMCSLFSCKKEDCQATPNPSCVCTKEFDPVCGCDNVTYSNACHAECVGIKDFTKGKCN